MAAARRQALSPCILHVVVIAIGYSRWKGNFIAHLKPRPLLFQPSPVFLFSQGGSQLVKCSDGNPLQTRPLFLHKLEFKLTDPRSLIAAHQMQSARFFRRSKFLQPPLIFRNQKTSFLSQLYHRKHVEDGSQGELLQLCSLTNLPIKRPRVEELPNLLTARNRAK